MSIPKGPRRSKCEIQDWHKVTHSTRDKHGGLAVGMFSECYNNPTFQKTTLCPISIMSNTVNHPPIPKLI